MTGSAFAPAQPAEQPLVEYRIYRLDGSGRIAFVPDVIVCEDDAAAIFRAQRDINGYALEIWAGARRVALVPFPQRG